MRRQLVIACLTSLVSCGGPDGERTGYLFTQTASGAPPLVETSTWKRRSMLPMALDVEDHPTVVTRAGTKTVVSLTRRTMTVVDADGGGVETLTLDEDVASDSLLVRGTADAVRELAELVGAEVTPSGRDFVLHSYELLDRMSFLDLPAGIERVDIVRLTRRDAPAAIEEKTPLMQPFSGAPAAQLHALLSRHGISSGTLRLGSTPTKLARPSDAAAVARAEAEARFRSGVRFHEDTSDGRVLELLPDGRATMTHETRVGPCGGFPLYEKSAGLYSVGADSIELTFDEYGDSFDDPPTTLVTGEPQRMVFGLRDEALYERGGDGASGNAWKADEGEDVARLRDLLSRNRAAVLDVPSSATRGPHPVARFQVNADREQGFFNGGRLLLQSDGTFDLNRERMGGPGCLSWPIWVVLRGWFFIRDDELVLVPTTEDTEDSWFGDHTVKEVISQPITYQFRNGSLVAMDPHEKSSEQHEPTTQAAQDCEHDGVDMYFDSKTGDCIYIGGQ